MKFIQSIKKLFKKKEKPSKEFKKAACELIINQIQTRLKDLNKRPKNLEEREWKTILNKMLFAFSAKSKTIILKSLAKQKMRQLKIKEGFRLFEVYFKEL